MVVNKWICLKILFVTGLLVSYSQDREVESRYDFDMTVEVLTQTIEEKGMDLIAVIDHADLAHQKGMQMPKTKVLLFGNPQVGTPLMLKNRKRAIELPLKILVWEESGSVKVVKQNLKNLVAKSDSVTEKQVIDKMQKTLCSIVENVQ